MKDVTTVFHSILTV